MRFRLILRLVVRVLTAFWKRALHPLYILLRRQMQRLARRFPGPFYSTWLHVALFIAVVGVPATCSRDLPAPQVITIDLVPISEVTNIQPSSKPKPEPKKPKKPAPKKQEKAEPKPKPAAKPKPPPKPKVKPKPPPKPKPKAPAPKKPKAKPKPKPAPKPQKPEPQVDPFESVLKTVEELAEDTPPTPPKKDPIRAQNTPEFDPALPLSLSEIDAIVQQISRCWSVPAGARDAGTMAVRLRISLKRDGTVSRVVIVEQARYRQDVFYRAAADAARRAVLTCSPLKNLPADKYSRWHELELNFDPKEMIY